MKKSDPWLPPTFRWIFKTSRIEFQEEVKRKDLVNLAMEAALWRLRNAYPELKTGKAWQG